MTISSGSGEPEQFAINAPYTYACMILFLYKNTLEHAFLAWVEWMKYVLCFLVIPRLIQLQSIVCRDTRVLRPSLALCSNHYSWALMSVSVFLQTFSHFIFNLIVPMHIATKIETQTIARILYLPDILIILQLSSTFIISRVLRENRHIECKLHNIRI